MNFNQLKYILAVDMHRNFAKAADECEVAQSTLSKEIQRLEKEFNILIFDRSRHPVVPTMKGSDLLQSAKKIVEEQQHFAEIAQKKNNEPAGDFYLAILPGIAPYLLPLFTASVSKKYPKLNLRISECSEKEIVENFDKDQLDAALTIAPFFKSGYYEDRLFEEEFVLYLNEKHPLIQQDTIRWDTIPFEELILQDGMQAILSNPNEALSLPPQRLKNITFENGSLETIRKIIDINGGMTILPKLATLYMGARRLKMVREITHPRLIRAIVLITPRGFEKNRISKVLRKEIVGGLPKRR